MLDESSRARCATKSPEAHVSDTRMHRDLHVHRVLPISYFKNARIRPKCEPIPFDFPYKLRTFFVSLRCFPLSLA